MQLKALRSALYALSAPEGDHRNGHYDSHCRSARADRRATVGDRPFKPVTVDGAQLGAPPGGPDPGGGDG